MNPRFPIYVISKGRWESRLTSKALELMRVPYSIVIEPQEYDAYAAVIDPKKILVLPFSNLGQGSIPARNWCWEHSISSGAERHHIDDDNINGWYRLNRNLKVRVTSGTILRAMEDFVLRYENIALAAPNYFMFAPRKSAIPAFVINTRCYSHLLIRNDIPFRWRGTLNEDTDLSLRVLKAGWCTILFNAFLQDKSTTMTMKGGNTDELYKDGREKFVASLIEQHPDVVTKTWKFGRWHHHVDYSVFARLRLKRKPNVVFPDEVNNYGMKLVPITEVPETLLG